MGRNDAALPYRLQDAQHGASVSRTATTARAPICLNQPLAALSDDRSAGAVEPGPVSSSTAPAPSPAHAEILATASARRLLRMPRFRGRAHALRPSHVRRSGQCADAAPPIMEISAAAIATRPGTHSSHARYIANRSALADACRSPGLRLQHDAIPPTPMSRRIRLCRRRPPAHLRRRRVAPRICSTGARQETAPGCPRRGRLGQRGPHHRRILRE